MLDLYYSPGVQWDALRHGPLGPHVKDYARLLASQGYPLFTGRWKLRLVAKLSRWLSRRRFGLHQLDEDRIAGFLKGRKKDVERGGAGRTMMQLLQFLRRNKIIRSRFVAVDTGPIEQILKNYSLFLQQERGLKPSTIHKYRAITGMFLQKRFGTGKICLRDLDVGDISGFLLEQSSSGKSWGARDGAIVLRSFLSFLTQTGKISTNLAASVPSVACWPLAGLPRFLEPAQVEKLLTTCDLNSPIGRRDYAVLLLLARLGLRAGEVVHLSLDDINWAAGEVLIRGKSAREDRLPLPPEVGQALADYLKRDRSECSCRRVFIRAKAPHRGFFGPAAIWNILNRALTRASISPSFRGTGLLRRSLATRMLRGGASLAQIGEVLRHQLAQTTEIYAKVDLVALRALAQPWPGGEQ
jgi:site-specific recombinase XerD